MTISDDRHSQRSATDFFSPRFIPVWTYFFGRSFSKKCDQHVATEASLCFGFWASSFACFQWLTLISASTCRHHHGHQPGIRAQSDFMAEVRSCGNSSGNKQPGDAHESEDVQPVVGVQRVLL